jgi:hypothetical protein
MTTDPATLASRDLTAAELLAARLANRRTAIGGPINPAIYHPELPKRDAVGARCMKVATIVGRVLHNRRTADEARHSRMFRPEPEIQGFAATIGFVGAKPAW